MAKKPIPDAEPVPCFEEALEKLESIVRELEDGKLGLTEALGRYEEGVKHLKVCYQSLREVERKIELLAGIDPEGRAITRPFDDEATTLDEQQPPRNRRRTPAGNERVDVDDSTGLF